MKFFLVFLFIFFNGQLFAKKDYYYGFIDTNTDQISEIRKQKIVDGFEFLNSIKKLALDGKIEDAFEQIKSFKVKNDLRVLESDISILYSELALKMASKRIYTEAANTLELDIRQSKINEYDIAKAYSLLVELKLNTNKIDDAKYYANTLINNFDDEVSQTYGRINLAKIFKHQKLYDRAIVTLYKVLTETKDKFVATIVADELFEVYLLNDERDKAKELIKQVLKTNIDYYANDSYVANTKIDRLIKADFPEYAIVILKELLNRTKKEDAIESFKFKLADIYMSMYDRTNYYLQKSKEIYEEIINDFPNGKFISDSKMFIDEILMRQGIINPSILPAKYPNSEIIEFKALLQEMLNLKKDKKYDEILKTKKVYKKIPNKIAQRFGFKSIDEVFDEINIEYIKEYLVTNRCVEISDTLTTARKETLIMLAQDKIVSGMFFDCIVQNPTQKVYLIVKGAFEDSRDAQLYYNLERMALRLRYFEDALDFSSKLEMTNNEKFIKDEFLVKYETLKSLNDPIKLERFFLTADLNKDLINANIDNPMIIDFYHDYYLYLKSQKKFDEAYEYLVKLYEKQKDVKAFIYSPFVEQELSEMFKNKKDFESSEDYLLESLKNARFVKPADEVKVYYDLIKLFEIQGNKAKTSFYVDKCKNVNGAEDSLYKRMCKEMN